MPRSPKMLDVEIQVQGALLCTSMHDLQLEPTETDPFWSLLDITLRFVVVPSGLFRLCPSPCHVQPLEVHIRALPTQSLRLGLHVEQRVPGGLPTGNVNQNVPARLHHVEPLAVDILQMGIASGSGPARTWSCDGEARSRAGRRGWSHTRTNTRTRTNCYPNAPHPPSHFAQLPPQLTDAQGPGVSPSALPATSHSEVEEIAAYPTGHDPAAIAYASEG